MAEMEPRDLDALIESALKGERMLAAPIDFHRKVEERVRIAALKERERVRFRFWMQSLVASACGALFLASSVVAVTNLQLIVTNGVSGGKGVYDYYLTQIFGASFETYGGAYTLATSVVLAGVSLVLGWSPVRRLIGRGYR